MSWDGSKIKLRASELGIKVNDIADKLEVTRQTVTKWIGGQIPRGQYLIGLCTILDIKPNYFFTSLTESLITIPQHRTVRKKKVTPEMKDASHNLAEQYLNLFRQAPSPILLPVVRIKERSKENAIKLSKHLRKLAMIPEGKPFNFDYSFKLLKELGIYAICREFPEQFKKDIYAFYSKICGQRVIFINTNTNILDLIFQLLHEIVHAIRDEEPALIYDAEEENFCDLVAMYTQFPDEYVRHIARYIKGQTTGTVINHLKEVSSDYAHSLYGIYIRLHKAGLCTKITIGGADTLFKRKFKTIEQMLYKNNDPLHYIKMLKELSPLFIDLISNQISDCSTRKFAEWLGFNTSMDAKAVIEELERVKE